MYGFFTSMYLDLLGQQSQLFHASNRLDTSFYTKLPVYTINMPLTVPSVNPNRSAISLLDNPSTIANTISNSRLVNGSIRGLLLGDSPVPEPGRQEHAPQFETIAPAQWVSRYNQKHKHRMRTTRILCAR